MDKRLNFSDLVQRISRETGAPNKLVHDLLIESGKISKEGLSKDGLVVFRGLGRFRLKWHEVRAGRNPRTGEAIEIAAHSSINYKAELGLREYINREYAHLKPQIIEDEIEKSESKETLDLPVEEINQFSPEISTVIGDEKKRSLLWLWVVIPLLIILVLFFFWPSSDTGVPEVVETEMVEPSLDKVSVQPVPEATAEQPQEQVVTEPVTEEIQKGIPGAVHTVKQGQNLWLLSENYYQQGSLWPNIYRANLNMIKNPDKLITGMVVQIPSLEGSPGSLSPKDFEQIMEGFVEVYLVYKSFSKEEADFYLWVPAKSNTNKVLNRYKDKIDAQDLKRVEQIKGSPSLK